MISLFAQTGRAGDGIFAKVPFQYLYIDAGGDGLSSHSSASAPTQPSPNCLFYPYGQTPCTEQFARVGAFNLAVGFRPLRYLQIDPLGVEVLGDFAGLGSQTATFTCTSGCTGTYTRNINSNEAMFTTGARVVLPLFGERLLVSGGGGFALLQVNSTAQAMANEQLACTTCVNYGRHGGPTEIAEVMYLFTRHIGVGVHARGVQTKSQGLTPDSNISNALFGTTYKERFLLIGGEISIRWGTHR